MATPLTWPSVRTLCGIFCCPPLPSKIAAKLAFVPPAATYALRPLLATRGGEEGGLEGERGSEKGERMRLELSDAAEWQFTDKELAMIDACTAVTARGETIACIYIRTQPDARYTLLFSHGNAVDVGQMSSFLLYLSVQLKADILSYDYSGYGVSTGRPTELNLYADIDAAYACLTGRYAVDPARVVLYGQSIGTVPTIDLAARCRVAGVVLHSPLLSGMRMAFPETKQTWFFDAFPSIDKVESIESAVLVIHGTEDEVINVSHGRTIYARCPRTVEPLWVSGAGHNDIEHYDEYLQRLTRFIHTEVPTS